MLTDFKTPRTTFNDDGSVTLLVRFYEGEVTTELEERGPHLDGDPDELIPVTRYRRTEVVTRPARDFSTSRIEASESRGNGWEIKVKADQDVEDTLRRILALDTNRNPIDEQKVVSR